MLDSSARNTFASVVLRLALGVVFIYHGLGKVNPQNEWGAAWATNEFFRQARPSSDILDKLADLKGFSKQQHEQIHQHLQNKYQEETKVPVSLESHAVQLLVAWGELLGGAAILLGLLTRLAALGLVIIQIGAISVVTAEKGFSFAQGGGYEYNVVLLAACVTLVLLGGGALAVDCLLGARTNPRKRNNS